MEFQQRNKMARKLTATQVAEMRKYYAEGATQGQLCRHFGVSIGQVGRIVRGESWTETERTFSPRDAEDAEQRLRARLAAEAQAPELAALAREFAGEAPKKAATTPPPSLLDGGDAPAEAPAALDSLQARAKAYDLDIEQLRRFV